MGFADLHIHSCYSDGSLRPEQIVSIARASNVELICVCDHNVTRGTLETAACAREAGVAALTGVEIDAIHRGEDIHILCYGADLGDPELCGRIRHARAALDGMSETLLERMREDYPRLNPEEYEAWPHDSTRGGWKMLQYLQARGVVRDMREAFPCYERYGVRYADAGFDPAGEVVRAIHGAGGRAVLAHPGVTLPGASLSEFAARLEDALDLGLDGAECYYPRHSPGVTRRCLEICARRNALITAGSDCHGAFNHNEIGQTRTPVNALHLAGLPDSTGQFHGRSARPGEPAQPAKSVW